MNIKSILVSQPEPKTEKNPFSDLAERFNLKVDFRSFIHVEGVDPQDFRQQRVNLANYTAVIFTSRMAIDHYFRIAKETRFTVPDEMKYFCVSEAVAYYLQNYVVYRKRKIFHGKQTFQDLMQLVIKHKTENFLVPCSDIQRKNIPEQLEKNNVNFQKIELSVLQIAFLRVLRVGTWFRCVSNPFLMFPALRNALERQFGCKNLELILW